MKTKLSGLVLLALGAICLGGCATAQPTADIPANDPRQGASLDRRSYSQEELQKRGRSNVGEALEAQDASVQVSGRH